MTFTIKEVLTNQVAEILPNKKGLEQLLKKRKVRLYLGIDPTGGNLHLGHAVALRKLQQFAALGHAAILLVGTGTVLAGDPSQRDKTRPRVTEQEIEQNIKTWKKQAQKILDFSKVKIVHNGDWLLKLGLADLLSIASNVSAARLFQREMFQRRLKKGDTVWTHELLYPLLQGYDSVALDVDLEIGGTDQVFNMLMGRELQRKMKSREKYVLTVPMIVGLDGKIMSKTSGNTVNLMDPPKEMYGKLMTLRDELIEQYFELCTDVAAVKVKALQKKLSPRDFKASLAIEIVTLYHSKSAAASAEREFTRVFREKRHPSAMPQVKLARKTALIEVLVQTKLASSKSEAKRLIAQGGVRVNGTVQTSPTIKIAKGAVLQVGKRRFVKIV